MVNTYFKELFSHAYILGGSPCSGKSTIAEMLSAQYDLCYYKVDDHDPDHMRQADPIQQPVMFKYTKIGWDDVWSQSVETLLTDELTYYHERFAFVLNDLSQLIDGAPPLLEGAAFLPDLICRYPVNPEHVTFMIPTLEFQIEHYSQRPWIQSILGECHNPKQAFENWMKRDHLFGLEVIRQANDHGYRVMIVDGSVDIPAQFEMIKAQFQL